MSQAQQESRLKHFEPPVRNADNDWLGPISPVGHVSEVNGAGAEEFHEFHAMNEELIVLAKYWAEMAIGLKYDMFLYGYSGSSELRCCSFAWARVGRIRDLLGEEVDAAVDSVYEIFGAKVGQKRWETYLHGSKAERVALQREIQRKLTAELRRRRRKGAGYSVLVTQSRVAWGKKIPDNRLLKLNGTALALAGAKGSFIANTQGAGVPKRSVRPSKAN